MVAIYFLLQLLYCAWSLDISDFLGRRKKLYLSDDLLSSSEKEDSLVDNEVFAVMDMSNNFHKALVRKKNIEDYFSNHLSILHFLLRMMKMTQSIPVARYRH